MRHSLCISPQYFNGVFITKIGNNVTYNQHSIVSDSKTKSRQDQQPKRKREESSKVSQIPVRAPIPSINKPKAKLQPEIIREVLFLFL